MINVWDYQEAKKIRLIDVDGEEKSRLIPKYYISRKFLVHLIKRAIHIARWKEKNGRTSDLNKQLADVLEELAERIENTQKQANKK